MDFSSIISFLPERWRSLALALLALALVLQQTATAIVALLPASAAQSPRWGGLVRALHVVSNARFRTELGTLKLPGQGAQTPDAERAALLARLEELDAQGRPTTAPPAPRGSAGRAYLVPLALCAAIGYGGLGLLACHPQPAPDSPTTVVTGWTDTARTVLSTLEWAVPSARAVVVTVLPAPAAAIVGRAFDVVADAASRLTVALDAYTSRGGDRCAVYAAVGGMETALVQLSEALVDHGFALGTVLERVAHLAAGVADNLVPACDARDAGWSSAGDAIALRLRLVERAASQRGVVLRRDLDAIRPGGAR